MKFSTPSNLLVSVLAIVMLAGCVAAPKAPVSKRVQSTAIIPDAPPVPDDSEIVLNNGMVVTASTPEGKITISAGPGLLRTVSWDGTKRYVVLKPRAERLFGSKGIYFEGHPEGWVTHNGMSGVKIEEGQRFFDNVDDANIWMQIRRLHYVHTNDGLVIGWKRKPSEAILQVEVWQFLIDGEKPAFLPNSKDYLIQIRQAPVPISSNSN